MTRGLNVLVVERSTLISRPDRPSNDDMRRSKHESEPRDLAASA